MNKIYSLVGIVFVLLMAGCTSSTNQIAQVDRNNSAMVHIYRTNTSYQRFNPEKPFFYIDDNQFAKLGTGMSSHIRVSVGKHIIKVKEPFLFMPSYESGRVEFTAEKGKVYYIRYSKDAEGIIGTTVVGNSKLQLVDKEIYLSRK